MSQRTARNVIGGIDKSSNARRLEYHEDDRGDGTFITGTGAFGK